MKTGRRNGDLMRRPCNTCTISIVLAPLHADITHSEMAILIDIIMFFRYFKLDVLYSGLFRDSNRVCLAFGIVFAIFYCAFEGKTVSGDITVFVLAED